MSHEVYPSPRFIQPDPNQMGRTIFNGKGRCFECHGVDADIRTGLTQELVPHQSVAVDLRILSVRGATSIHKWFQVIRDGRPGTTMVAFRDVLSEEEIRLVVHFLRDLQGITAGMESRALLLRPSSEQDASEAEEEVPRYRLQVTAQPQDCLISFAIPRLPYYRDMQVPIGAYLLDVRKDGYQAVQRWVEVSESDIHVQIILQAR